MPNLRISGLLMTVLKTQALRLNFPRSAERCLIEALRLSVSQIDIVAFPRSNERGLIERMSLSPFARSLAQCG